MKAKAAHFYGWTDAEIESLNLQTFYQYIIAIPVLQAQSDMRSMVNSTYPHMKKEVAKDTWKKYERVSNDFYSDDTVKEVKLDDIAMNIAGMQDGR